MAFDFVTEYRALQPTADRTVVTARTAAFEKIAKDANDKFPRVVDLAYFAYRLPFPSGNSEAEEWFETIVRTDDDVFSLTVDKEEAARIATLVLRQRLAGGLTATPVLVHAAAFAGKRQTVDKHELSKAAQRALENLVRRRGNSPTLPAVSSGKAGAADELVKKLAAGGGDPTEAAVLQAIHEDYRAQIKAVVSSAKSAIDTTWAESRRLAEEVDLLWWHLGGHSYLLDRPIAELPDALKPVVIGMDIGEMINQLPGSFGTYGIIRKALGDVAEQTFKLSDITKALSNEFSNLAPKPVKHYAVTPLLGIVDDKFEKKVDVTNAQFKRFTGLGLETKLTGYELALQAFNERILNKLDYA